MMLQRRVTSVNTLQPEYTQDMALTFADWVRGHRMQRRWSQGELARRLDIHRSYISRIESGAIQLPELETRQRFHDVFGTEEADLEAYGIVPRYDEWGRVLPGTAEATGGRVTASDRGQISVTESATVTSPGNPFDTGDLRWHVVEALRTLDMTSDQNEWLMQMFLRELKRDDYPRTDAAAIRDAG
jgi:DNA-binding XRE family transcriptional regulator